MKKEINFTHYWIEGLGWKETIYKPDDFITVEKLGESEEGIIYLGYTSENHRWILLDDNGK